MVNKDEIVRLYRAGMGATVIARVLGCSRQYVYIVLWNTKDAKSATLTSVDDGVLIVSSDRAVAATAVRNALIKAGWDVEG